MTIFRPMRPSRNAFWKHNGRSPVPAQAAPWREPLPGVFRQTMAIAVNGAHAARTAWLWSRFAMWIVRTLLVLLALASPALAQDEPREAAPARDDAQAALPPAQANDLPWLLEWEKAANDTNKLIILFGSKPGAEPDWAAIQRN